MHLPTQLLLDGKELSPQSLHRSAPPDHKMTLRVPTTVVGEPEEREGFRLPLFAFSSIRRREASELDQPRLLRMDLQTKLGQPLPKISQEPLCFRLVLKTGDEIVGVANDDDIAPRDFLPPDLHPQVEDIVQIHVGEQRRNHCPLWRTHRRLRPFAIFRDPGLQPFLNQP